MDEEALAEAIRGAQNGDSESFDRLVEAYAGRIFGFLYRATASRHDAEDLMQEVFVRVVRKIGAYRHDTRFEAWIFRIAGNLVRDRVRRSRRAPTQVPAADYRNGDPEDGPSLSVLEESGGRTAAADFRLVRHEEIDALNEALAMLPEAEREVIMLRHFSELSFKEIAALMETPLGTALARSHRGLARLREIMTAPVAAGAADGEIARPAMRGSA